MLQFVSFVQNCGLVNFSVDEWILEVTSPVDEWLKILNETPDHTDESKHLAYRHILKTVVKVVEEKFNFLCFSSLPAIRRVDPPLREAGYRVIFSVLSVVLSTGDPCVMLQWIRAQVPPV